MTLEGKPLGGWAMYALASDQRRLARIPLLPSTGGTRWTRRFCATGPTPGVRRSANVCLHLMKPDANGVLKLPLSSSPEIYHNSPQIVVDGPTATTITTAWRRCSAGSAEMANVLGKTRKRPVAAACRPRPAGGRSADQSAHARPRPEHGPVAPSLVAHRFRFTLRPAERRRFGPRPGGDCGHVPAIRRIGHAAWCGYSFSWMACLRARVGDAQAAITYLDIYQKAFILRNGFHANGDQLKAGYSGWTYRPFTLEGNFLASQAVHEILLQSWGGVIRVFPAVPSRWHEAAFDDLRGRRGIPRLRLPPEQRDHLAQGGGQPRRPGEDSRQLRRRAARLERPGRNESWRRLGSSTEGR